MRPTVELTEIGWRGACYLRIVGELVDQDAACTPAAVAEALASTGGPAVFELLEQRMPPLPPEIRCRATRAATAFMLRSIADAPASPSGTATPTPGRTLPAEDFIANLVAMAAGMLAAPHR